MNLKQQLFINHYTEGETKNNCEQSMLKAGYKRGYARGHCGTFLVANSGIKKAIEDRIKRIKIAWEDRITRVIARLDAEIANTTSISQLCLLVNAQKGYMEMQAKNEGKYQADNAQRAEQIKLTEAELIEAKELSRLRLEEKLKGNPKIINIKEVG